MNVKAMVSRKDANWEGFSRLIASQKRLPSCKVAESYGIRFEQWFELSQRNQNQVVLNAERLVKMYDKKRREMK